MVTYYNKVTLQNNPRPRQPGSGFPGPRNETSPNPQRILFTDAFLCEG